VGHAIGPQCIELVQAKLKRVKSEQIGNDLVDVTLLPFEQVSACGRSNL
jgi:hypothetical protein